MKDCDRAALDRALASTRLPGFEAIMTTVSRACPMAAT